MLTLVIELVCLNTTLNAQKEELGVKNHYSPEMDQHDQCPR